MTWKSRLIDLIHTVHNTWKEDWMIANAYDITSEEVHYLRRNKGDAILFIMNLIDDKPYKCFELSSKGRATLKGLVKRYHCLSNEKTKVQEYLAL